MFCGENVLAPVPVYPPIINGYSVVVLPTLKLV